MHDSGLCLSSRSYSDKKLDEDLFSGFITAMASFIQEIAHDVLTEIKMEQNHIFYESSGSILLTIVAASEIDRLKLAKVFQEILDEFFHSHQEHLNHHILSRRQFSDFAKKIDYILTKNGFIKKLSQKPKPQRRRKKRKRRT
jgi:hypothetical protein